jgi:dCTP deaminase
MHVAAIVNVTPLEPEGRARHARVFQHHAAAAKIYANEGVAQMLFFESDEVCSTPARERGGEKVPPGQRGVDFRRRPQWSRIFR